MGCGTQVPVFTIVCLLAGATIANGLNKTWSFEGDVGNPFVDLGSFPHNCITATGTCTDGFTVSFLLKPSLSPDWDNIRYVLSSGGQSSSSEGFYLRHNYGMDFEVGVSRGSTKWTVDNVFLSPGEWAFITFVWNRDQLQVYVDNILAKTSRTGVGRQYVSHKIDPLTHLTVGVPNSGVWKNNVNLNFGIKNLNFWNTALNEDIIEGLSESQELLLGCVSGYDHGVRWGETDQVEGTNDCRKRCYVKEKYLAVYKGKSCNCFPKNKLLYKATDTCQADEWFVYRVSHVTPKPGPESIHLEISFETLHLRDAIDINETAVVKISTKTEEHAYFVIDFGDGHNQITVQNELSHAWTAEGMYEVNVTAITRTTSASAVTIVNVVNSDKGYAPEFVHITFDLFSNVLRGRLLIFDKHEVACILRVGEQIVYEWMGLRAGATTRTFQLPFPIPGIYVLFANCTNRYGTKTAQREVHVMNDVPSYRMHEMGKNVNIPLHGLRETKSKFEVSLDQTRLPLTLSIGNTSITIDGRLFNFTGERYLEIFKDTELVYHEVLSIQEKITEVSISQSLKYAFANESLDFNFTIASGSSLNVFVDYGDGSQEHLYFSDFPSPVVILRSHTYNALGFYRVSIEVSNELSYVSSECDVSVERSLGKMMMSANNVSNPNDTVVFRIQEMESSGNVSEIEIFALFDFGNGTVVEAKKTQQKDLILTHFHIFSDYGIYTVTVKVWNNVSSVHASTVVQVGQNISSVDLWTTTPRVKANENVTFEVVCPKGSPVIYEFDFGDGTEMKVSEVGDEMEYYATLVSLKPSEEPSSSLAVEMFTSSPQATATFVHEIATARMFITENFTNDDAEISTITTTDNQTYRISTTAGHDTPRPSTGENRQKRSAEVTPADVFYGRQRGNQTTTITEGTNSENVTPAFRKVVSNRTTTTNVQTSLKHLTNLSNTTPSFVVSKPTAEPDAPQTTTNVTIGQRKTRLRLKHSYKIAGEYEVKLTVHNQFGSISTRLCPNVLVAYSQETSCEVPVINLPSNMSFSSLVVPIQHMRSSPLVVPVQSVTTCANISSTLSYSWTATRFLQQEGDFVERPTLDVCLMQSQTPLFTLPPRTLSYGLYKLSVYASPNENPFRVSSLKMFLEIVPSSLLVKIRGESIRTVMQYDMVTFDMGDSRDPDVTLVNDPDFFIDVVCASASEKAAINKLSLKNIKDNSRPIGNSTNLALYEFSECFAAPSLVHFPNHKTLKFSAGHLNGSNSYVFLFYVRKDVRVARADVTLSIRLTNFTAEEAITNLDSLLESGDTTAVLSAITMAAGQLDKVAGTNETDAKATRSKMRAKMLGALNQVSNKLDNFDQLQATTNALKFVTDVKDEVSSDSKVAAASALKNVGSAAKNFANQPLDNVKSVAGTMINAISNLLPSDVDPPQQLNSARRRRRSVEQPPSAPMFQGEGQDRKPDEIEQDKSVNPELYEYFTDAELDDMITYWHPCDREVALKARKKLRAKELKKQKENDRLVTNNAMGAASSVSDVLAGKQEDNSSLELSSPSLTVKLQKLKTNATEKQQMNSDAGSFQMPNSALSSSTGNKSVSTKFFSQKTNPYTWDTSGKAVDSGVLTLEYTDPDGNPIPMNNMSEPVELWIQGNPHKMPKGGNYTMTSSLQKQELNYHSIVLAQNDSSLHVILRPENDDVYEVFVKYLSFPNETYYDYKTKVPIAADETVGSDPLPTEDYHFTLFPSMNITRLNGTYYIGIKLAGSKVLFSQSETNHTYNLRMFTSGCKFWNESTETWSSDGCTVGPLTSVSKTQCLCTHLTAFGGDFVVPPNTIDFNTVFDKFKNLSENAAVFSTVISILVLYFGLLVWARWADKKDLVKWGATPLEDNLPTDGYHYQLSVYTSMKKNAGTESNVSFIICGDMEDTGVRKLSDGNRKGFKRGSIMNFLLSVEASLGSLTMLRIWHDNSADRNKKSWYLDQIEVTDLQSGQKFFFLVNRWLAVEEDDGLVERIVPVATMEDLCNFKQLFSSSVRKKLTNDHLWFSVVSRPTRSNFTRVQRISCCVSLLFCTMITNCMWFKSEERVQKVEAVKIGPLTFTMQQLFVSIASTLIVFPVNLILVTIFRKARPRRNIILQSNQGLSKKFKWKNIKGISSIFSSLPQKSKYDKFVESLQNILSYHKRSKYDAEEEAPHEKKKKKPFSLPWWSVILGWILCFFSVVTCAFFTILYSMEWGKEKAEEWLTTFILSFFQSVVVVQPIKVFAIAAFISCILKKPELEEEDGICDSLNDNKCTPIGGELFATSKKINTEEILMQRKHGMSTIKPPDPELLAAAREERLKEIEMEAILKSIIVYILFLLVLFFIAHQSRDSDSYTFAANLKKMFAGSGVPHFSGISKVEQFWSWISAGLMPSLYAPTWYNGKMLNWREALMTADMESVRVGVARIRQLRVKNDSCKIQPLFQAHIDFCRSEYSWTNDDTKSYFPGWVTPSNGTDVKSVHPDSPWVYQSSLKLKNAPYPGILTTYKGGGYTQNFGCTKTRTEKILKDLQAQDWVDLNTRAVFVEFALFSANTNLFASVQMVLEFMSTGGAVTKVEVKVFRLFSYVGSFGLLVLSAEIIYVIFLIYFLQREVKLIIKQRFKYFNKFWNFVEFATLVCSLIAIVMYVIKHGLAKLAMDALHESGSSDFVNFQSLALYDELFGYVVSLVVFWSTVKLLKLLSFNRRMEVIGEVIRYSMKDLKSFLPTFLIYFFAFCQSGYLIFGKLLPSYGSVIGAFEALFAFSLGDFDFEAMSQADPYLGPGFFIMFIALVYVSLLSMFMTILNDALAAVKARTEEKTNDYEMVDFIWRTLKNMFGIQTGRQMSPEGLDDDDVDKDSEKHETEKDMSKH